MARVRFLFGKQEGKLNLTLLTGSTREALARSVPQLGQSRNWSSETAFVAPRYLKRSGHNSLVGQVQSELVNRGFPPATKVEVELEAGRWLDAEEAMPLLLRKVSLHAREEGDSSSPEHPHIELAKRWRHFRVERPGRAVRAPSQPRLGLRLTFEAPVVGPLSLGFGSHFGLGLFAPSAGFTNE